MPIFTNKATLSFNGGAVDSNTVTGNFTQTLTADKNALIDTYTEGSTVTYVISLTNIGGTALSGITATDDLGAYLTAGGATVYPLSYVDGSLAYYVDGILQATPTVTSEAPLVMTGITVPAGGDALLVYQANTTAFAPLSTDSTVVNTVTMTGGGLAEPIIATETVSTLDAPALSITKSLCPTVVVEDGALTYTFVIENRGNTAAVATDNLVVSDTFDPILTISSVTLNGTPLTEGTEYTYDPATGEFSTVAGVITVPAATFPQNPDGSYVTTPGTATLIVNGSI